MNKGTHWRADSNSYERSNQPALTNPRLAFLVAGRFTGGGSLDLLVWIPLSLNSALCLFGPGVISGQWKQWRNT